jgi:hypothetical protein
MTMNHVEAARLWCLDMARRLPKQDIRPHDTPYLTRYFAAGWSPFGAPAGPSIFLHHFVASDPNDAVHSHPWDWGCSLILVGGYVEHRWLTDGTWVSRTVEAGDVNVILPTDRHRVDLLGADCWSLFLAGVYAQPWGFYRPPPKETT